MKVVDVSPKNNPHKIVATLCTLQGTSRKILCLGAYLITALDIAGAESFLEYTNDLIHSFKAKYQDPFFIIASDWNRADPDIAFDDFVNITPVPMPPTR